jgi:hypothetical protein
MNTLSKIAVLFPLLAAACGGTQSSSSARAAETLDVECSVSMDARSSALQVAQRVSNVLDGKENPCGDTLPDLRAARIALSRIDHAADGEIVLVFHVTRSDYKPLNVP